MGRTGPAPKPTALRVLHGDRKSRINLNEPRPRDQPPGRPAWLSPMAAEEWDRIAPDLDAMGTVKAVDATALACYCEAVGRLRVATRLVAETGPLLIGEDGRARKNPAVGQARDASYEVRMWAREFGLTPSARSPLRIEVGVPGAAAERLLS
jgi:P27 family predicted phage terminase small subunit